MFINLKKFLLKKNLIFFLLVLIFLVYFIINFISSFFQNKILSILNSNKFENFIIIKVENYLERLGDKELTEKEIEYYSRILNKINQKFKPVLDRLQK